MAAATTWGELRGDHERILTALRADEVAYRAAYFGSSPKALRDERREELLTTEVTAAGRTVDATVKESEFGGWTVSFPVKNPTSTPLESPAIGIVCRNAQGKINGAGFTFPDLVPPNGEITADSDVTVTGTPDSCKAYIAGPVF